MSEVTKAVIHAYENENIARTSHLESLLRQYKQSDIQEALDELINLEKKCNQSANGAEGPLDHPQIFSIEIFSGSAQELDVIKRTTSFLLQNIGESELGTIILDLHCSLPYRFYESVWRYGEKTAQKHLKHFKVILRISLLLLDGEIVSATKTIPLGIQLVLSAENSISELPDSVKTSLEQLLLQTYPIGVIEESNETKAFNNLQTLAQSGISIVHQSAGKCVHTLYPYDSNICVSDRRDLSMYFAPSESLKYLSLFTTSLSARYHCGAGRWYWAVSSSGKIYPCHRFIGDDRFLAGHISNASIDIKISSQFAGVSNSKKATCQTCWARHLCGGGCSYNAISHNKPLNGIDDSVCTNIKHNIEQAAVLFAELDDASRTMAGKLSHTLVTTIPYWQARPPEYKTDSISFISSGDSMLPLIQDGATLTIEYIHPRHLRMGEIFTYRKGQKIVTHRLMGRIVKDGKIILIEKGDNAFFADTLGAEIIGRVVLLKNPGMREPLNLDVPLWRVCNTLIVVLVTTLWITYFMCRFGGVFLIQILKQRSSIIKAARATIKKGSLYQKSQWLLTVTNRITQLITRLLFFIYSWEQ
jgi:signal peptidase I